MKTKMKIVKSCRGKKGCTKTSWELLQGNTFEQEQILKKKAA